MCGRVYSNIFGLNSQTPTKCSLWVMSILMRKCAFYSVHKPLTYCTKGASGQMMRGRLRLQNNFFHGVRRFLFTRLLVFDRHVYQNCGAKTEHDGTHPQHCTIHERGWALDTFDRASRTLETKSASCCVCTSEKVAETETQEKDNKCESQRKTYKDEKRPQL